MTPTTTLKKIAGLRKRIKGIRGGQGAGKTFSILLLLINHASSHSNREIIICSHELTKMRMTVIKDFINIMRSFGIYEPDRMKAGVFYQFKNGSFIHFIGLDKADIGKGLRGHVLFINECNKIGLETATQLIGREWHSVYLDWNPDTPFWFESEYQGRDNVDFISVTFRDNEYIGTNEKAEILSYYERGYHSDGTVKNKYWANKARVYGDGEIGQIDGAVFENWQTCADFPNEEYTRLFGIDWGGNDPNTLVEVRFYSNKRIYLKEWLYKPLIKQDDFADLIKSVTNKDDLVIADSARKDKVFEMQCAGINCISCEKGAGSVMDGIGYMQNYDIYILNDSVNTIREFTSYRYAKDKMTGLCLPMPIDKDNHAIDPARYAIKAHHLYGY